MIPKLYVEVYMTYIIYDVCINTGYIACMYYWYKIVLYIKYA